MKTPIYYEQLVLSCVDSKPLQVVEFICNLFNTFGAGGYHFREDALDFGFAYEDVPVASNQPLRAVFWEPKAAPGRTAFMTNHSDGMAFGVSKFATKFDATWIQTRICDKADQD